MENDKVKTNSLTKGVEKFKELRTKIVDNKEEIEDKIRFLVFFFFISVGFGTVFGKIFEYIGLIHVLN